MPQLPEQRGGEGLLVQGAAPAPVLLGGLLVGLATLNSLPGQFFLGAQHPHRQGIILSKRQIRGVPKLYPAMAVFLLLLELPIRATSLKQPHGIRIKVAPLLFQGNDYVPAQLLRPRKSKTLFR